MNIAVQFVYIFAFIWPGLIIFAILISYFSIVLLRSMRFLPYSYKYYVRLMLAKLM